ncbi:hypothetical protein V6N12_028012 [Hibiscus sabdariffa]|uniref:Uncharacterized protein n=1 Tax=Hibiscus sabdariffa TaxID=183260 RepID=A0ABR2F4N3_9ROSI
MIDLDYICYPIIAVFIEEVGILKQNIEYLAYLEPGFSLDGSFRKLGTENVGVENNEERHVLGEIEVVGPILGETEAAGPLYEDTEFVGPILGERDDGNNVGSEKVKFGDEHQESQPKRTATDSQMKESSVEDESSDTDYIESERDFKGEILVDVGRDGNNQIFLVAWAAVEVENRETWA